MSQRPLRLYVDSLFTSPYAMSVYVTLREKGLAFETGTSMPGSTRQQISPCAP